MKIETFAVSGKKPCATCRGSSGSTAIILDRPVSKELLDALVKSGQYAEAVHMTKAGILYVENKMLTIHGSFGRKQLSIKCKFSIFGKEQECNDAIEAFKTVITSIE
jgi:hypothetical protein